MVAITLKQTIDTGKCLLECPPPPPRPGRIGFKKINTKIGTNNWVKAREEKRQVLVLNSIQPDYINSQTFSWCKIYRNCQRTVGTIYLTIRRLALGFYYPVAHAHCMNQGGRRLGMRALRIYGPPSLIMAPAITHSLFSHLRVKM